MKFLYKNETYTLEELNRQSSYRRLQSPILATGPDLPLQDLVYAFSNERDFYRWTQGLRLADKFATIQQSIKEVRQLEHLDHTHIMRRKAAQSERIAVELQELANHTGLALNSMELFLQATDKNNVLEGAIFDPAILWTGTNFTGNFLALAAHHPNLGWASVFNNSVSSIILGGMCILFENPWFRGASFWFSGVAGYTNLGAFGWSNRASSVALY
jgi:hypothetical protein